MAVFTLVQQYLGWMFKNAERARMDPSERPNGQLRREHLAELLFSGGCANESDAQTIMCLFPRSF